MHRIDPMILVWNTFSFVKSDYDSAHDSAPHRHKLIVIASAFIAMFTCSILASSMSAVSWRLCEIIDPNMAPSLT
eukprot:scaffold24969_cov34-Attheya_sp.AAC.1